MELETTQETHVIGVGASAGGLDALSRLFNSFDTGLHNFCLIVVQHLSPDYKSELTSILSKRCVWPVVTAENETKIQPQRVYVTPQNCSVRIKGNTLMLEELPDNYSNAPSIDEFFISLAKSKKQLAIGIILSGFGHDGAKGMEAIKEAGGFTIVQDPQTADHKDMPNAAINTNSVDVILDPRLIYEEIILYINNHAIVQSSTPKARSIDAIFELLANRLGTDFSQYKSSTIMRRMDKRIQALRLSSHIDYYKMIKQNPNELDILFETVLIGITEFFRDKEAFEALRELLTDHLSEKKNGDNIRVWSVGCASGEEPYSIAILLHEILGERLPDFNLQIFASDIDDRAISKARKGEYTPENLDGLDPVLIDKYFEKNDKHYDIKKQLKQYVLFSKHDITNDPPFVKLDLVTCRNLLIYFNNALQAETLKTFHYSLVENGLLMLGKSESVSTASGLFAKADRRKLFRKVTTKVSYNLRFSRLRNKYQENDTSLNKSASRKMSLVDIAKETLYFSNEHPFVIVNDQGDIKEVQGSVRLYLEISKGAMTANLLKMVNKELTLEIRTLLAQVKKSGKLEASNVIKFTLFDKDHYVRIKAMPFLYPTGDVEHFIFKFDRIDPDPDYLMFSKEISSVDFADYRIKELEQEVEYAREHLQTFNEELETSNEELQSLNEELQSANEELKSTNEELETSNEELQSTNEELHTANSELRHSNQSLIERESQLKIAKSDSEKNEILYRAIAENIPNGTVGILNDQFEIEYIAGKGLGNYDLQLNDIVGKNLLDLNPSEVERKKLHEAFSAPLRGNSANVEFAFDNRVYSLYTIPLHLNASAQPKIMYLTQDITVQKRSDNKFKMAVEAAHLIAFEYDLKTDTFQYTPAFTTFFELEKGVKFTQAMYLSMLCEDDLPARNTAYEESLKSGKLMYETRLMVPSGTKWIRVFGRVLYDYTGAPETFLAAIMDISRDKELLDKISESEQRFRAIADSAPVMIWMNGLDMENYYYNEQWLKFTGRTLAEEQKGSWLLSAHPNDREAVQQVYSAHLEKRESFSVEYQMKCHDGTYRWIRNIGVPRFSPTQVFEGYIGSCVDITDQKLFTGHLENEVTMRTEQLRSTNEQLVKVNDNLQQFAYIASHDLQEPLRKIRMFISLMQDKIAKPELVQQYSRKIALSADRMSTLIRDILKYSEVLENTSEQTQEVDINRVIETIELDCELLIEEKNALLQYGDLGTVPAVEIQLYQLLLNLIKNALKFNNGQPMITLTSEEVSGTDIPDDANVNRNKKFRLLTVKDNGIGFDNKFADNIFGMFTRLHNRDIFAGTGIGLALCRKIVEKHHGYITARSEPGEGAAFFIYLPL